jgi:uracil DNA glycosylase
MLKVLLNDEVGRQWYYTFTKEMRVTLHTIDMRLSPYWESHTCFPSRENAMLPFMLVPPHRVKMVMLCKEPYNSGDMCTGIPVEVRGNKLETPSAVVFRDAIRQACKCDPSINGDNYMRRYYEEGVLVINASFTARYKETRQELNHSHYPLWCTFVKPFIEMVNAYGVDILVLGGEGSKLVRNVVPTNRNIYTCTFPKDKATIATFKETIATLLKKCVNAKEGTSHEIVVATSSV